MVKQYWKTLRQNARFATLGKVTSWRNRGTVENHLDAVLCDLKPNGVAERTLGLHATFAHEPKRLRAGFSGPVLSRRNPRQGFPS